MQDQYTQLSKYYDEFVQKNRDYVQIAQELHQYFGNARQILDIGIGTGLVVERLLQIQPDYRITGIDTSESLLSQARQRLGERTRLLCQSVSDLRLETVFDLAYSRGGAWTFVNEHSSILLASHILDSAEIQRSFNCVSEHLVSGGTLIISASNAYGQNHVELDNGIIHKRNAETRSIDGRRFALLDYQFYRGEELLAQQQLKLRLLDYDELMQMLSNAGFVDLGISTDHYYLYRKQ